MKSLEEKALDFYLNTDDAKSIGEFVSKLGNINKELNSDGQTLLHLAAKKNATKVMSALVRAGADVNIADSEGNTALHLATQYNSHLAADLLLAQPKINLELENYRYNTPLAQASLEGNIKAVKALLKAGANPNAKGMFGRTVMMQNFRGHGFDAAILDELINYGAETAIKDEKGKDVFDYLDKAHLADETKTRIADILNTDSKRQLKPMPLALKLSAEDMKSLEDLSAKLRPSVKPVLSGANKSPVSRTASPKNTRGLGA